MHCDAREESLPHFGAVFAGIVRFDAPFWCHPGMHLSLVASDNAFGLSVGKMNSDTGTPPRSIRVAIAVATMLSVVAVVAVLAVIYMTPHSARERAVVGMGAGLVLFWCVLGGALQRL